MQSKEPTRPRLTETTWLLISEYRRRGFGESKMLDLLRDDDDVPEFADEDHRRQADEKRLKRAIAWLNWADSSARWQLADTEADIRDPSNTSLIFDVLVYTSEQSAGSSAQVTQSEARWIIRLRKAYPDMPPDDAWRYARLYMLYVAAQRSTHMLDLAIAFAPWRGPEEESRFAAFLDRAFETESSDDELGDLRIVSIRKWRPGNAKPYAKIMTEFVKRLGVGYIEVPLRKDADNV